MHPQQSAAVATVGQRQQPEQGQHAAGLGGSQQCTGHRGIQGEIVGQALQQRLREVDIGHAGTGSNGEQAQQRAGQRRHHHCGCNLKLRAR
ncbi:hypothetical protein D3C73_1434950 [compost metagenome]